MMAFVYLWPAGALWLAYGIGVWRFDLPWWVDYPMFGAACAATAIGWLLSSLANVGPRW
jgi:hypothetical protein